MRTLTGRGTSWTGFVLLLLAIGPLTAQFVELGAGGNLLMNVPFCGG